MKALSLKQPYAELILNGKKKVETRTWNTEFRGEFYIHASGNIDEVVMKDHGVNETRLPKMCLVGTAMLVDVKKYESNKEFLADKENMVKRMPKSWESKTKYGFILKDVRRLKNPIPYKGSLGFFEVKL